MWSVLGAVIAVAGFVVTHVAQRRVEPVLAEAPEAAQRRVDVATRQSLAVIVLTIAVVFIDARVHRLFPPGAAPVWGAFAVLCLNATVRFVRRRAAVPAATPQELALWLGSLALFGGAALFLFSGGGRLVSAFANREAAVAGSLRVGWFTEVGMVHVWILLALSSRDWACEHSQTKWNPTGLEAPCVVVAGATPTPELVASAMKRWSLDEAPAQCAISASLQSTREDGPDGNSDAEDAWRRCVEQWPNEKALWVGFLTSTYRTPSEALLGRLAPAPADGGTSLAEELMALEYAPHSLLALHVLKTQPHRLGHFLRTRPGFELSLVTLEQRRSTITAADWEPLGRELMSSPLQVGRLTFAADLWMQLPAHVRASLRSKAIPAVWHRVSRDDASGREEKGDQRSLLALGLILSGRKAEAALIPVGETSEVMRDLVQWHLTGERTLDAWEGAIAARDMHHSQRKDLYALLLPYVAPHQRVLSEVEWLVERGFSRGPPGDGSSALQARERAEDKKAFDRLAALVPPTAAPADAGVALPSLPPRLSVFVERNAPWRGKAAVVANVDKKRLPRGFWPWRSERVGSRLVVLALSQRLDPVGEVSPGGYWLLISKNDGGSWQQVYLGLGDHRPFHALTLASVPLLDVKGVVRVVVDDAPLREATITFPPVAKQATTVRSGVVLEASLSALTKDSDGDQLTDLVEERLLLDPMRKDTDGDGVPDGADATPRLDDRLPATPLAEMYNAFFEHQRSEANDPSDVRPRKADLEDVTFVIGASGELAGLRPLSRIVTLSLEELEAAKARFGAFYPVELTMTLNGSDHAFVLFSTRWRGGTYRIDRDADGRLVVTPLSFWVS